MIRSSAAIRAYNLSLAALGGLLLLLTAPQLRRPDTAPDLILASLALLALQAVISPGPHDPLAGLLGTVSLGAGLLFGLPAGLWTLGMGMALAWFIRRYALSLGPTELGPSPPLTLDFATTFGRRSLPLAVCLTAFDWDTAQWGVSAGQPLEPLLITLLYALTHGLLALIPFFFSDHTKRKTPPSGIQDLVMNALLPVPFVYLASLASPQGRWGGLVALGALPGLLALWLMARGWISDPRKILHAKLASSAQPPDSLETMIELEELLPAIQDYLTRMMEAENFYIALWDVSEGQLWYPLAVKDGQRQNWPRRALNNRLTDRVIREHRSLLYHRSNSPAEEHTELPPSHETPTGWVGVPLGTSEQTLGCLAIFTTDPKITFSSHDEKQLSLISKQISLAIQNALLYQQAQRRALQMEHLNRQVGLISASLDLQKVLAQFCRAVTLIGGGQRCAVYLIDPDRQRVQLAYSLGLSQAFIGSNQSIPLSDDPRTRCLRSGRPYLISDLSTLSSDDPRRIAFGEEAVKAAGDFPLTAPQGQIGYVSVYFNHTSPFRPEQVELLQALASQASLAISNARMHTQTEMASSRRAHQLTILEAIGRELSAAIPTGQLFDTILDYALEFTNTPWGSLNLLDPASGALEIKSARGYDLDTGRYPAAGTIAGQAIQSRKPINIGEVSRVSEYQDKTGGAARSMLCIPLVHEERVLGVLAIESPHPQAFTTNDQNFLCQLANQAAIAMINASLYEETRRRLQEQAQLYAVSKRLVGNLKLERVLENIVQAVGQALKDPPTGIYMWDAAHQVYLLQATAGLESDGEQHLPSRIADADWQLSQPRSLGTGLLHIPRNQSQKPPLLGDCHECQVLILPLSTAELRLGMILVHLPAFFPLHEDHLHLPRAITAQGAIAIQNALLFSDLTQSRDRLEAIINSVEEGVLMVDARGEVILGNTAIEKLTGTPLKQIFGRRLADLPLAAMAVLGVTADQAEQLVGSLGKQRHLPPSRATVTTSDQPVRVVDRFLAPVWGQGRRAIGWVFVLRDISEEFQLNQARELITETLVHDLRSPVSTISSALSIIGDALQETEVDPVTAQSVDIARRSTERVLGLVESLLDISRMEAGIIELNLTEFPLRSLVQDLLLEFIPQATQSGIVIDNRVPENGLSVRGDRQKIGRVLANLIDNALKFTPEGGQIYIAAESLESRLTVVVGDTGPGIPEEYREKIFDRFSQVPDRRGRRRGSGIGLTFCRLAVEAHGERIWAEPRPKGGSLFKFTLQPVAPVQEQLTRL